MEKYVLIDGNNLLKKCHHIPTSNKTERIKTKAVYFFLNYISLYLDKFVPNRMIVFWDGYNGGYFKHQIYPPYKANRRGKSWTEVNLTEKDVKDRETFSWQKKRTQKYLDILGIDQIEKKYVEADDLMALTCKLLNFQYKPENLEYDGVVKMIHQIPKQIKVKHTQENFDALVEEYTEYLNINTDLFNKLRNLGGLYFIDKFIFSDNLIPKKAFYRAYSNILFNKNEFNKDVRITIVSNDRDFLQLVDKNTSLYVHDQKIKIDESFVKNTVKTTPKNITIKKAIFGDTSDNIKGIKGLGGVTEKLITEKYLRKNEKIDTLLDKMNNDISEGLVERKLIKKVQSIVDNRDNIKTKARIVDLNNPIIRMSDHSSVMDLILNDDKTINVNEFEKEYRNDRLINFLQNRSHTSSSFISPFKRYKQKFESDKQYIVTRKSAYIKSYDIKINKDSKYWYEGEDYRSWFTENFDDNHIIELRQQLKTNAKLISYGETSEKICNSILEILNLKSTTTSL